MTIPNWLQPALTALIGAAIGFICGYVSDVLKAGRSERGKRARMRRALYVEMAQHYYAFKQLTATLEIVSKGMAEFEAAKKQLDESAAESRRQLQEAIALEQSAIQMKPEGTSEREARVAQLTKTLERTSKKSELQEKVDGLLQKLQPTILRLFRYVGTDSHKYAKSNPDLYYELPDAWSIDAFYSHLYLILSEIESL